MKSTVFPRVIFTYLILFIGVVNSLSAWDRYFYKDDVHAFEIEFPADPTGIDTGEELTYTAVVTDQIPTVIYTLHFSKTPSPILEINDFLADYVVSRTLLSLNLLERNIVYHGNQVLLHLLWKSTNSKVFIKETIFIDFEKSYFLSTTFYPPSPENHSHFVNSFRSLLDQ